MVVAQLKASTGIDLSHVFVETDPQLAQQGKAGAAIGGKEIHVAPGHEEDTALLAHEAGHIVQQMPLSARGSAEQKGPDDEAGRAASRKPPGADNEAAPDGAGAGVEKGATDLEAEADAVATAVLSGGTMDIRGVGTGVLYEEETEGDAGGQREAEAGAADGASVENEQPITGQSSPLGSAGPRNEVVDGAERVENFAANQPSLARGLEEDTAHIQCLLEGNLRALNGQPSSSHAELVEKKTPASSFSRMGLRFYSRCTTETSTSTRGCPFGTGSGAPVA